MSEISINIETLEQKINKLRTLQSLCNSTSTNVVNLIGDGKSINIINEVDQEYGILKSCFEVLLENSIQFFENVKQSVVGADENIASNIGS